MSAPLMKKQSFIRTGEGTIATYNYQDIANGLGYAYYYGVGLKDSAGAILGLTGSTVLDKYDVNAAKDHTRAEASTTSTANKAIDLTFTSSTFNSPRIMEGALIANIPYSAYSPSGATTWNLYLVIDVYKNTDLIATATSDTRAEAGSGQTGTGYFIYPIIIPKTLFGIGDYVSINVKAYLYYGGSAGTIGAMITYNTLDETVPATNPAGSASERLAMDNTTMRFDIPFRINL